MGTLYVVATPIGNLEDVTLRALRVLSEAAVVAAEDTRLTRRLFARHGVRTPLLSFHEHSSPARRAELLARLETGDVALVTDAGTPGVSDPGALLVADALAAGHRVSPIPGPSAVAAALSASGMPADEYVFVGFLPRRAAERRSIAASLAVESRTIVAYEAPHRLRAALEDLAAAMGPDRPVVVARELTKAFEEVWRGTLGEARERWSAEEPRGELTLVVAGSDGSVESWGDDAVSRELERLRAEGLGARAAAREVAARARRPAREVYRMWHHDDRSDGEPDGRRGRDANEGGRAGPE